jgi:predicted Zn-dependent peptidase
VIRTNRKLLIINGFIKPFETKLTQGLKDLEKEGTQSLIYEKLKDETPHVINEYLEMKQAIIELGYHLPVFRNDKLYEATLCFDLMVGGYAESILFKEIREKEGLCYDIRSSYDAISGTLVIKSGVDLSRKAEALQKLNDVMLNLESYGLNENALVHAKKYVIHQIKSSYDEQGSLTMRAFFEDLYHIHLSLEEKIKLISNVKFQDILEVMEQLKLQTTYVLSGDKNDN